MLIELSAFLIDIFSNLNVLQYLTTRTAGSLITSLLIVLLLGNKFIAIIDKLQYGQFIRDDGPKSHKNKQGTPSMGGVLIICSFICSSIIWGNLHNKYLWIVIFTALSFTILGFIDDFLKVKHKNSDGLSARLKFFWQSVFSFIIIFLLIYNNQENGFNINYLVPSLKDYYLEIGVVAFAVISFLLIVGTSNAVNLTDGLDGLAIMPTVLIASGLAIYAYISSNFNFSAHLYMEYMPHATEIMVLLASLIGAGLGFLWFNTYPAQIFMGDSGSLSLGAILAVIAIIIRQEVIFILMSLVFMVEMFSVIIQLSYFKYTKIKYDEGKRFFLMAPLHHHFEKKGMSEPKIIVRGWIITLLLVLIALALIKIR